MIKQIIAIAFIALMVAGCATNDPNRGTKSGAVLGGVIGAVVGKQIGGDTGASLVALRVPGPVLLSVEIGTSTT